MHKEGDDKYEYGRISVIHLYPACPFKRDSFSDNVPSSHKKMKMSSACRSCFSNRSYTPQPSEEQRRRFPYSAMAKFASVFVLIFIILIVALVVYGELPSNGQQSRSRLRSKTLKKKKIATTIAPVEDITTALPPEPEIEEIIAGVQNEPVTDIDDVENDISEAKEVDDQGEVHEVPTTTAKIKPKKSSNAKYASIARSGSDGCDVCELDDCLTVSDSSCPTGLVLDRCACCQICGAGEGNRCYNASLNLRYNPDIGICGPGLSCLLRSDLEPTEPPEALCECQDKRMVCGSDNQTYSSECKLREIAHNNLQLVVNHWGPCISAPWISTPVENMTVGHGEDVSMSCEVRGYPPPIIHWKFLEEKSNSAPIILPGDDSSVVIVVRGGPEQMMTTSWIQIISVTARRQGTYFCIAKNAEGMTQSFAGVSILPPTTHQYNDHILR